MPLCPCDSKKEFEQCCGPYLSGEAIPETALDLMRSRYTAYSLEEYHHVIATSHESNRPTPEDFEDEPAVQWTGLEILKTEEGGPEDQRGIVEFIAHYQSRGTSYSLQERSIFVREDGRWSYLDGDVLLMPVRSEKTGRNTPCPCGSGKKYKKCCLRDAAA